MEVWAWLFNWVLNWLARPETWIIFALGCIFVAITNKKGDKEDKDNERDN